MDADASAHAVADDRTAFGIDIVSLRQVAPAVIQNFDELPVGCIFLWLMDAVGGAEHFVEIGHDGRVAELGEVTNRGLHMAGDAVVMVYDHHCRAAFFAGRIGEITR